MSDYTQITSFTPKDALASGNPAKLILGADIDPEFAAISVAIATKADTAGAGISITGTTVSLDVSSLTNETALDPTADTVVVYDDSASATREMAVGDFVSGIAGQGLQESSDVLVYDIPGLGNAAPADADSFIIYDDSTASTREATIANLAVLFAGLGLAATSSVIALDIDSLTTVTVADVDADFVAIHDVSAGGPRNILVEDLFDISRFDTENTIDTANDEVLFYDDSASVVRKTAISNIGGSGAVTSAHKTALTSRTSTTTSTADPDLDIALTAGYYAVEAFLIVNSLSTVPDFRFRVAYTGTANTNGFWVESSDGVFTPARVALNVDTGHQTSTTDIVIHVIGVIEATGAGDLSIAWAQNTSSATATRLGESSWLTVRAL